MILSKIKNGCKIGFFGVGRSNASLLRTLPLNRCRITIRSDEPVDLREIPKGLRIERLFFGKSAYDEIDEDIIFFSPSIKRERQELMKAKGRGVIFTSDAELFFEENPSRIIAVTGSDGKSTTATLTHLLLRAAGHDSTLIGNIGIPFSQKLGNVSDFFVSELSSFMLEYCSPRSERACITNITPNHLNWHESFEKYRKTKLSIAKNTEKLTISDKNTDIGGAYGIISAELDYRELRDLYKAELYITAEKGAILKNNEKILEIAQIRRSDLHDIKNLMMAISLTDGLVGIEQIAQVSRNFSGLPHRCELFLRKDRVDYIDSSIDTTPARTVETLSSLKREVVIILGGGSKGADYSILAPTLEKYAKKIILCGENAEEIYFSIGAPRKGEIISSFEDAVRLGAEYSREVGTLLLSPASTSFDKFKSYAERGEKFKEIILNIK